MLISSPEAFLEALEKSRLLTPQQMDEARDVTLLTDDFQQMTQMFVDQGILTEWQLSQLLAHKKTFFLGNYVLLGLCGRGNMGSVFLARHTTMNRQVAIKVLPKKVGKNPEFRERFLTEARASALLDHPNIVQAFDVDKEGDRYFIVMEYVPGYTLEDWVELEGPLDLGCAVDFIRQTAAGLAHAHGRNMIHCDIKPSNLLVNEQGVLKILDMGMARLINTDSQGDDSSTRRDERILGTVDYMSPEQAIQGPNFDHRADIYSLGCTFYYLLTGRPPFAQGTLTQRILMHQTEMPVDPRELCSDIPQELVDVCMKMMEKDPDDRFQNAEEIIEALPKWKSPRPIPEERMYSYEPADEVAPFAPEPEPVDPALEASLGPPVENPLESIVPTTEGPAIEKFSKHQTDWSDEKRLTAILGGIIVTAVGFLVILMLVFLFMPGSSEEETASSSEAGAQVTSAESPPSDESVLEKENSGERGALDAGAKAPSVKDLEEKAASTKKEVSSAVSNPAPLPNEKKEPLEELPERFFEFPTYFQLHTYFLSDTLIGMLIPRKGEKVEVELVGGDLVLGKKSGFELIAQPDGKKWVVHLTDKDGRSKEVACFGLAAAFGRYRLLFSWLESGGLEQRTVLRDTLLKVRVGSEERLLPLRRPRSMMPLKIDPLAESLESAFTPESNLETGVLRLELTGFEGPLKASFEKGKVLRPGESLKLTLDTGMQAKMVLDAKYEVKEKQRFLKVTGRCSFENPFGNKMIFPFPAAGYELERHSKKWKTELASISKRILVIKRKIEANQDPQKDVELNKQLKGFQDFNREWKKLEKILGDKSGLGTLYFREYLDLNGVEVDLNDARVDPEELKDQEDSK